MIRVLASGGAGCVELVEVTCAISRVVGFAFLLVYAGTDGANLAWDCLYKSASVSVVLEQVCFGESVCVDLLSAVRRRECC